MFKKYIFIFVVMCLPLTGYAGTMIMEDYPIMYFPDKNGVKLETVQEIVADAVDRSSYPQHLWTIDSEKPGEIIARLNVRTHVLRMKITFDSYKINYQYYDSTRLNYSENESGTKRIHAKYKPWSEFLLEKIKFVAKRKTKMDFVSQSPIQVAIKTTSGEVVKPVKIVVSAFGAAENRAREAGIYSDEDNSALIAKELELYLNKNKSANIHLSRQAWNKDFGNFIKRHKNSDLNIICKQEEADVVIIGFLERYLSGTAGLRSMYFYSYDCAKDEVISEIYEIRDSYDDKFPYQLALVNSLKAFVHRYNLFKL